MKRRIALFLIGILTISVNAHAAGWIGNGGPAASGSGAATLVMTAGNGKWATDAATAANVPAVGSNASSSSAIQAPAITPNTAGDYIISVVGANPPSGPHATYPSTPTVIWPATQNNASYYELWAGYQVQPTTATLAARTGTQPTSSDTVGASIALVPVTGKTPVFTAATVTGGGTGGTADAAGTVTFTLPTTPVNGTLLLACRTIYNATSLSSSGTTVTTFNELPGASRVSNHESLICTYRWANNEAGDTYTAIAPASVSISSFLFSVTNIVGFDMPMTSASAAFVSGDKGKDLCLRHGISSTQQACGEIGGVLNSTTIIPTFIAQASLSAMQYTYCTDHTSQWTALSTFTGGIIAQPFGIDCYNGDPNGQGHATIVLNPDATIIIQGSGLTTQVGNPGSIPGTMLDDMTTTSTAPAMSWGTASSFFGHESQVSLTINDFVLWAGTATDNDGGGSDGLAVTNMAILNMNRSRIQNFSGTILHVLTTTSAGSSGPFMIHVGLFDSVFNNGGHGGVLLECDNSGFSTPIPSIQDVDILRDQMVFNNGNGLELKNCSSYSGLESQPLWSINIQENIFQGNHAASGGGCTPSTCQQAVNNRSRITGGAVFANYFEDDSGGTNVGSINQATGWTGVAFGNQTFSPGEHGEVTSSFLPVYSAAGTPIDPCDQQIAYTEPVCVSDATSSTAGTTYATGGSTTQQVMCNGTNWIIQGTAGGCVH